MNNTLSITRINHEDPLSKAALAAQQRFFDHYGIDYQSHIVEMDEPQLRLRVLEAGEGSPLLMVPGGARPRYQLRAQELEAIAQPVQFIWGDNDVFGDLSVAQEAARCVPNARLHQI